MNTQTQTVPLLVPSPDVDIDAYVASVINRIMTEPDDRHTNSVGKGTDTLPIDDTPIPLEITDDDIEKLISAMEAAG